MPHIENTTSAFCGQHEPLESRVLFAADVSQLSFSSKAGDDGISEIHRELGIDGYGQTIAIIDSGIAYDHAALGGGLGAGSRVVGGWDFAENDAQPYDDAPAGFHGTHVAGIVGSSDDANLGIAPRVDIVGLRIFSDHGYSQVGWLEESLAWVHENKDSFEFPITTVNLSVGFVDDISDEAWDRINSELSRLHDDGIFVSVAAGNSFRADAPDSLSLAGRSEFVFPVASVDGSGQMSHFSQRHDRVLAAPGENIVSTAPDYIEDFNGITDDYQALTGTSMAAPFVAGASVLVRQAMEEAGHANVTPQDIYDHLRDTADEVFDAETGRTFKSVNVYNAVHEIVSAPNLTPSPESGHLSDLGSVDHLRLEAQDLSVLSGYRVEAANGGILSVAVTGQDDSSTTIRVFDNDQNLLPVYGSTDSRVDVLVDQHASYSIEIQSNLTDANVHIANLVSPGTTQLHIFGTDQDDRATVMIDRELHLDIDGFHYEFSSVPSQIVIEGKSGSDQLEIVDRSTRSARLSSSEVNHRGGRTQVTAHGFEEVALDASGSNATAEIVGENLSETIEIESDAIEISSIGFEGQLEGFSEVSVYGNGGRDRVRYNDSQYDDHISVTGETMLLENHLMSATVFGVDNLTAFSHKGGTDSLEIYDTPQDDRLLVSPNILLFRGSGTQVLGMGFEETITYAQGGGRDQARLYGSEFNDMFSASPVQAEMTGTGYNNSVAGFHTVMAYAGTGDDRAELSDSPGNDRLVMKPNWSRLRGPDFSSYVSQFDTVIVESREGVDQAFMHDSVRDDDFYASPVFARMSGDTFYNLAKGFERVNAIASLGQDRARLFDSVSDDQFVTDESASWLRGSDFWNRIEGFDEVDVHGGRGRDVANFEDLSVGDLTQFPQKQIEVQRPDSTERIWGFDDLVGLPQIEK